jgi:bis(5'-nucleosidyl)-tetraphosphatase
MARDLPQSRACGFVLTRERDGDPPEYLLLVNQRDGMPGLPKGHQDPGEDDLETALRETREETGLTDLEVLPGLRTEIAYRVKTGGEARWKTVVYFRARLHSGKVRLSEEHTDWSWQRLDETLERLTFDSLRDVIRTAALHGKDPTLFRMSPTTESAADRHLASLPGADAGLLAHLRGGARLARAFAQALAAKHARVDVEAAAAGTLLHDVGRALGRHEDHQLAGLEHLRTTPLAPYGFACVSHFTKGASEKDLLAAGVPEETIARFRRAIDGTTLLWEERCAALADACMKGPTPVPPRERFADLRVRYDAKALIDLQERRTDALRASIAEAIDRDPLGLVGLA